MITPLNPPMTASIALLFLTYGCSTPLPEIKAPQPDAVPTDAWNKIHTRASEELACPIERLNTRTLSSREDASGAKHSFEITGCRGTDIFFLSGSTSAWAFVSDMDLRKKLQFSYGDRCPTRSIQFIDDTTRGVEACDQKTIYVLTPSGWVANTTTDALGKTR